MVENIEPSEKQTEKRRSDGKFAAGNHYGRTFQPGQSGNPKGRPKSITLSEAYRKMLAEVDETDEHKRTRAEVLAEQMYTKAKSGDVSAFREIADRVEGKARQTITISVERREQLELSVQRILEHAAGEGISISREEAINDLAQFVPDARSLLIN